MSSSRPALGAFRWQVTAAGWRWLMLSSLVVATNACWGKTDDAKTDGLETGAPGTEPAQIGASTNPPTLTSASPVSTSSSSARFRVCSNPTPLGGGWERCASGLIHRAQAGACAAAPHVAGSDAGLSGCVVDSDCFPFEVCLCGSGPVGTCTTSACITDADCEGDALCANFDARPGCNEQRFFCQSPQDQCATAADCGENQECTLNQYSPDTARYCSDYVCAN